MVHIALTKHGPNIGPNTGSWIGIQEVLQLVEADELSRVKGRVVDVSVAEGCHVQPNDWLSLAHRRLCQERLEVCSCRETWYLEEVVGGDSASRTLRGAHGAREPICVWAHLEHHRRTPSSDSLQIEQNAIIFRPPVLPSKGMRCQKHRLFCTIQQHKD